MRGEAGHQDGVEVGGEDAGGGRWVFAALLGGVIMVREEGGGRAKSVGRVVDAVGARGGGGVVCVFSLWWGGQLVVFWLCEVMR